MDLTVAYITTEVDAYAYSPYAVVIENKDLAHGQLKKTSVIRTDKLLTIDPKICKRVNVARLNQHKLAEMLKSSAFATVATYYQSIHKPAQSAQFIPGQTRVNYAGRVYDETEMVNLVDASLDFWLTAGPYATRFEKAFADFLGVRHCSLTNSGSSANLLAFMALTSPKLGERRIMPGEEVITVAAGFPTTVAPIIQYGAVPVFVDVRLPDANVEPAWLEQALSPRTRAVMLAHTLGFPFDLKAVKAFCDRHGLWLIEDNCDALGSRYRLDGQWRYTGTTGHLGTSSFYPPHHITMGEGGAVYTDDPELKRIVESLRDWGRDCWCPPGRDNTCGHRFDRQFGTLPFGYDHKYVYSHFGYNLKVTDMQAAIGCAQLEKLASFTARRKENYTLLRTGLADLDRFFHLPELTPNSDPSWFGFLLTLKDEVPFTRNQIVEHLEAANIQTRNLFAGNITRHPCFMELKKGEDYRIVGDLEMTDNVMNNSFWIGVYPGMRKEMIDYMIQTIREYVGQYAD
jgi:CDP-6-deoxy-D-xylo-4-hexulose-3-dehydrase